MNSSDRFNLKHKPTQTTFARSMRLSLALAVICLWASQTTMAQTSYSDMWLANAPSAITSTASDVAPPVDEIDSDQTSIAGCGITEDDYTSYNLYQSVTKIRSPSGVTTTASGGLDSWSRADVSLPINLDSPEEGDYMIETKHSEYPYDNELVEPTGPTSPTAVVSPTGLRASIFSWVTRLFGGTRPFKIVYRYMDTFAVTGLETLYRYQFVCQSTECHADPFRIYSSKKFGFHPPYVVIRGVKLVVNLLFTRIYSCVGKSTASYGLPLC
jgi:hypothetical protein